MSQLRKVPKSIEYFDAPPYEFLSNFYPAVVHYEGITYPTTEHAYQAAKTLDRDQRYIMSRLNTPGRAKKLGQRLALRADWNMAKFPIMRDIVAQKFTVHRHLAAMLLATDDAFLLEGNTWHDNVWGSCVCAACGANGQNHLGRILMEVRAELKEGANAKQRLSYPMSADESDRALEIISRFMRWTDEEGQCPISPTHDKHWFKKLCALAERLAMAELRPATPSLQEPADDQ